MTKILGQIDGISAKLGIAPTKSARKFQVNYSDDCACGVWTDANDAASVIIVELSSTTTFKLDFDCRGAFTGAFRRDVQDYDLWHPIRMP